MRPEELTTKRVVAVIGSFRRHLPEIQEACSALRTKGFDVTSPKGTEVIEGGVLFVRFESDNPDLSDPAIQSLALHRIFRADAVYVLAPSGYVGRTTCYEVGRLIQARKTLYFSAQPKDLPIIVPEHFIVDVQELIRRLSDIDWQPTWLFETSEDTAAPLERELIAGRLRDD
jgi:hypothetical protein